MSILLEWFGYGARNMPATHAHSRQSIPAFALSYASGPFRIRREPRTTTTQLRASTRLFGYTVPKLELTELPSIWITHGLNLIIHLMSSQRMRMFIHLLRCPCWILHALVLEDERQSLPMDKQVRYLVGMVLFDCLILKTITGRPSHLRLLFKPISSE
jgi:hypothetical protein